MGASCGLNIWVAWCSLRSAWSPPGTTQAPFRRSGSTPIAAWSIGERPQRHKGPACARLVTEAEFVRAPGFPAPWGDPPRCSLDGGGSFCWTPGPECSLAYLQMPGKIDGPPNCVPRILGEYFRLFRIKATLSTPFLPREGACCCLSFPSPDFRASIGPVEWASKSLGVWWRLRLGVLMRVMGPRPK